MRRKQKNPAKSRVFVTSERMSAVPGYMHHPANRPSRASRHGGRRRALTPFELRFECSQLIMQLRSSSTATAWVSTVEITAV
jgi:hypothetical protein